MCDPSCDDADAMCLKTTSCTLGINYFLIMIASHFGCLLNGVLFEYDVHWLHLFVPLDTNRLNVFSGIDDTNTFDGFSIYIIGFGN